MLEINIRSCESIFGPRRRIKIYNLGAILILAGFIEREIFMLYSVRMDHNGHFLSSMCNTSARLTDKAKLNPFSYIPYLCLISNQSSAKITWFPTKNKNIIIIIIIFSSCEKSTVFIELFVGKNFPLDSWSETNRRWKFKGNFFFQFLFLLLFFAAARNSIHCNCTWNVTQKPTRSSHLNNPSNGWTLNSHSFNVRPVKIPKSVTVNNRVAQLNQEKHC